MMPIRADPDPHHCTQTCSVYADALGPDPTGLGVADIRQQNIETQAPTGPTHSYNSKLIRFLFTVDQNSKFLIRGPDRLFCLTKQVLGQNFDSLYTYPHREGGGTELTREKVRRALLHKAGRKYQHD
jgi:hypothetical protein